MSSTQIMKLDLLTAIISALDLQTSSNQKKKKTNTPSNTSSSNPNPSNFLPSFLELSSYLCSFAPLLLPFFPLDLLCSYLSLLACFLSFKAISTQQSSEPTTFTLCQIPAKEGKAKNG
jgi:hypothetical protein